MNILIEFKDGYTLFYEDFDSAQHRYNKAIEAECVRVLVGNHMFWYRVDEVAKLTITG